MQLGLAASLHCRSEIKKQLGTAVHMSHSMSDMEVHGKLICLRGGHFLEHAVHVVNPVSEAYESNAHGEQASLRSVLPVTLLLP